MDLKDLKFTKEDFDMLIKGIEGLPNQDTAGELMSGLLDAMLGGKLPPEERAKMKEKHRRERMEKEKMKETLREDCYLLQAKLIRLRRYMEQNDLIMEAQDIIDGR